MGGGGGSGITISFGFISCVDNVDGHRIELLWLTSHSVALLRR